MPCVINHFNLSRLFSFSPALYKCSNAAKITLGANIELRCKSVSLSGRMAMIEPVLFGNFNRTGALPCHPSVNNVLKDSAILPALRQIRQNSNHVSKSSCGVNTKDRIANNRCQTSTERWQPRNRFDHIDFTCSKCACILSNSPSVETTKLSNLRVL